jgi:hypothetical protein
MIEVDKLGLFQWSVKHDKPIYFGRFMCRTTFSDQTTISRDDLLDTSFTQQGFTDESIVYLNLRTYESTHLNHALQCESSSSRFQSSAAD